MTREIEFAGYIEFLESFTFRKEDAINIPKEVREVAFSLQIDIEIISTIGNDYKNFKVSPPSSFYGYAVLVFRGFADIEIPIKQARQRLYYGKLDSAYTQWEALHHHRQNRIYRNEQIVALGTIWGALGLEEYPLEAEACPLWLGFEELPLREVYVECAYGTQFRLHVSYWIPVIKELGDGCTYEAKSGQVDRDEDDNPDTDEEGLPSSGSQPRTGNPSNPYGGLPSISSPSEEGNYSNSKIANTDDINPSHNVIPYESDPTQYFNYDPATGKYWVIRSGSGGGDCATRNDSYSFRYLTEHPPNYVYTMRESEFLTCEDGSKIYRWKGVSTHTNTVIEMTSGYYAAFDMTPTYPP